MSSIQQIKYLLPTLRARSIWDYFELKNNPDHVEVKMPRDLIINNRSIECSAWGSEPFPAGSTQTIHGNGVWIFPNFDQFAPNIEQGTKEFWGLSIKKIKTCVRRQRKRVDIVQFLNNNADNTIVAVIDMASKELYNIEKAPIKTIGENQEDVIRQAQKNDIPIYEVYCKTKETVKALHDAMKYTEYDTRYQYFRQFIKPGTGGATDPDCIQEFPNDVNHRARAPTFLDVICARTRESGPSRMNVVVMGMDAAICVGKSIFGCWTLLASDASRTRVGYNPGILDLNKNVITSRQIIIAGNNGPLPTGYTYMG